MMSSCLIYRNHPGSHKSRRGFTLIELLIVVAIIGILAAIAIPNFLLARTRSNVARVKADMSNLGTALEMYYTDNNHYPYFNEWALPPRYNEISYRLIPLTTPVDYISRVDFRDPFLSGDNDSGYGDGILRKHYNYRNHEFWVTSSYPDFIVPVWVLNCIGPDQSPDKGLQTEMWARGMVAPNVVTLYDPTNGTVSKGDMPRTGGMTKFKMVE